MTSDKAVSEMKLRIVVIDDEECIRDSLKWHLSDLGHEVIVSEEPLQCDVILGHDCSQEQSCADVLITDNNMPGMKGLDLIELMQQKGCRRGTEFKAIISGAFSKDDLARAARIGCKIIWKPFSFDELEEWIEEVKRKIADEG